MVVFKAWAGVGGGGVLLGSSLRSWWHGGISLRLCRNNGATKRIFSPSGEGPCLALPYRCKPNELFPEPRVGMKPHEPAKPIPKHENDSVALHRT